MSEPVIFFGVYWVINLGDNGFAHISKTVFFL
jgi:hypothetical protein